MKGLITLPCFGGPLLAEQSGGPRHLPVDMAWIVPSPPGGGPDLVARTLAAAIGRIAGIDIRVQNVEGANGEIALARFFNESPHPRIWLMAQDSVVVINPLLHPRSADDILHGLSPVAQLAKNQFYILVHSDDAISTLDDLLERSRDASAPINYGSGGVGSQHHLLMEDLARQLGLNFNHVAYRGNRPAAIGLTRGDISVLMAGASALPFVEAGELRMIAVTSPERLSAFPDVPALGERVPGFFGTAWFGLFGRAGMEAEYVSEMSKICAAALADPETIEGLRARGGIEADFVSGEAFREAIHADHQRFSVIHAAL